MSSLYHCWFLTIKISHGFLLSAFLYHNRFIYDLLLGLKYDSLDASIAVILPLLNQSLFNPERLLFMRILISFFDFLTLHLLNELRVLQLLPLQLLLPELIILKFFFLDQNSGLHNVWADWTYRACLWYLLIISVSSYLRGCWWLRRSALGFKILQVIHSVFFILLTNNSADDLLRTIRIYHLLPIKALSCYHRWGTIRNYRDRHWLGSSENWLIKDFCVLFWLSENDHIWCGVACWLGWGSGH